MHQLAPTSGPKVARFREYLCLLARAHLPPRNEAKIEASDIVQQTLLDAYERQGDFQGRSLAQLAGHLQRTEAAIAGLLRRGLKKLRKLMDERIER